MNADVIIIGGGLAGAASAIQLARAGRSVTLVERSSSPHHKVCGEFLSAEALAYLDALGVNAPALGAVPIHSVRLAGVTRALPFRAMSLTRYKLDEELLRIASESGATVLRGRRVQSLQPVAEGWSAQLENGSAVTAQTAFLATGKHDLFGHTRPPGKQAGLVGLKTYFRLTLAQTAALHACVELLLYPGGYAGLQPVDEGAANLCALIDSHNLQRLSGRWDYLLAHIQSHNPTLCRYLADSTPLLEKPLAIAAIPYGYVRPASASQPGLWPLGDQAAVIPSFTGDGMSIALHTGCLAAAMYSDGATSTQFQQHLHTQLARQIAFATSISRSLVHPIARPLVTAATRLFPNLLGLVASHTRIPQPLVPAPALSSYGVPAHTLTPAGSVFANASNSLCNSAASASGVAK